MKRKLVRRFFVVNKSYWQIPLGGDHWKRFITGVNHSFIGACSNVTIDSHLNNGLDGNFTVTIPENTGVVVMFIAAIPVNTGIVVMFTGAASLLLSQVAISLQDPLHPRMLSKSKGLIKIAFSYKCKQIY